MGHLSKHGELIHGTQLDAIFLPSPRTRQVPTAQQYKVPHSCPLGQSDAWVPGASLYSYCKSVVPMSVPRLEDSNSQPSPHPVASPMFPEL